MNSDLKPEKNQALDDFQEEEEEGGIFYACRNCGGKHPHGEPRSCKDGENDE